MKREKACRYDGEETSGCIKGSKAKNIRRFQAFLSWGARQEERRWCKIAFEVW